MGVDPVVLSREQKYFDAAWEHRERMRQNWQAAPGAAAHSGAAVRLKRDVEQRLKQLGEPDEPVAFGRMDEEDGEVFYLGKHAILDDESELVVINWKAPIAARFYEATHADPRGLVQKRDFRCSGNTIESFQDTLFQQLAAEVAELEEFKQPSDALLTDLESNRTGEMQDIVRTIQAAQFELIRAPLDQLLVIQGGPGTGKTAVALHRVSWLLFNHRNQLSPQNVLIVGPNPTFTRYTRTVLPSLGDENVTQLDLNQLAPRVKRGRVEDPEVVRLKGDGRMAGLVERALQARAGSMPEGRAEIEVQVANRLVRLTAEELEPLFQQARNSTHTYTAGRQSFRELLTGLLTYRVNINVQQLRVALDPVVERFWPSFSAASFLRELYGSRDRLIAAAGDHFTAGEVSRLYRRAAERVADETWSDADHAVLDEVDHLLHGRQGPQFAHIVVDEAQDLSPMQLRSVARRSETGSLTIVGDIAQSTGPWARDDWDDVLRHLPTKLPRVREELRFGYRVPRQVFELAAELLSVAAPTVTKPEVVRDGPADPAFHPVEVEERAGRAVRLAMDHAAHGRSVAIVSPASCRAEVERELTAKDVAWRAASSGELGPGINLLSPQEAKGLEFDAVVVLEREEIKAEEERGHRLLYVALTRTTRYLDVVESVPAQSIAPDASAPVPEPATGTAAAPGLRVAKVDIAEVQSLAADITAGLTELFDTPSSGAARSKPRPEAPVAPVKKAPETATQHPAKASSAPASKGSASHRFVELGAEEVVTLLRETVAPNLWEAVLARAGEILAEEG